MATKVSVRESGGTSCFVAVGRNPFAIVHAFAVLAAHRPGQNFLIADGLNGVQNFCLLIAHRVGVERNRRLHGGQGDQLHDVVGDHVAQRAGVVEIAAAALNADGFGDGNLDVIDIAAIPDRLENSVGEAERQNILNSFFAEIMVDPVDLFFVGDFEDC